MLSHHLCANAQKLGEDLKPVSCMTVLICWRGPSEPHSTCTANSACICSDNFHLHFTIVKKCAQNGFNVNHGKYYLANSLFIGIFPNIINWVNVWSLSQNPAFAFIHRNLKYCCRSTFTNLIRNRGSRAGLQQSRNQTTDYIANTASLGLQRFKNFGNLFRLALLLFYLLVLWHFCWFLLRANCVFC